MADTAVDTVLAPPTAIGGTIHVLIAMAIQEAPMENQE